MKTKIYEELAHLFPLWRETVLKEKGHEKKETQFVIDVFNQHASGIKTVIDLGGGVGTHAKLLVDAGYNVTLLDQSQTALEIAKRNNPTLKTVCMPFEAMDLTSTYDAAICMWSTLSYVYSESGRKHFYDWQRNHIKQLIILDQANFYRYPESFSKKYVGENADYTLEITRDWVLTGEHLKETKFIYCLANKRTRQTEVIEDAEAEQYVTVERLQYYLGRKWELVGLRGDYDLKTQYDEGKSPRIITVFKMDGS